MKKDLVIGLCLAVMSPMAVMGQHKTGERVVITPIEHATMVIQSEKATIYVDPVGDAKRFAEFPEPDVILITHIHRDHLAPDVIDAVKGKKTTIVGPKSVIDQLKTGTALGYGHSLELEGRVTIRALPAYNTTKDRLKMHPKGRDNGYVLTLDKKRIYISGDTEDIKEMRELEKIDHAFVCMNLPYTMSEEQAADAVLEMKPKVVTPYHFRGRPNMGDVEKFKRLVSKNRDIEVRLMNWYGKKESTKASAADLEKRAAIDQMYAGYKKDFKDTPEITAQQLAEWMKKDAPIIVDVREPAEMKVSIIPGAITHEEFDRRSEEYKGKKIVTYCTIGYRSGLVAKKLRKDGFDAVNLIGSILSWTHAGGELVNAEGKTKKLHVYGDKWDLAPYGYETVWYGKK